MLTFFAFFRAATRRKLSGLFESVSDFHKFQTYNLLLSSFQGKK